MTAENFETHLLPREAGLYCPAGDFYIDPVRPVERALITHGHADHARAGHRSVLATPETLAIMRLRYGQDFAQKTQALAYGERLRIGDAEVWLVPAGHVLGSAQAVIDSGESRFVVSGDYKRRFDPTCAGFEPVACDVFVTEATFALPVFRHPDSASEVAKLVQAREIFPERAILAGAYALGKAQRLIALLRRSGYDRPIYLHGALEKMCALYEEFGIDLGRLVPVAGTDKSDLKGEIVMAPPSALADRWSRRLPDPLPAFASGWM
ncbi:MAG: ligase-associated DNA damage response exonuclease, partial [Alphaproteobacteria bacterium]|nr:ligase-associated DNA damage response exonuclease [Alphaproteobacteria bacterium]